jgi:hypothetical protein
VFSVTSARPDAAFSVPVTVIAMVWLFEASPPWQGSKGSQHIRILELKHQVRDDDFSELYNSAGSA